jgi:hypothetical protein
MTTPSTNTSVLSVRVSREERAILEAAAEQAHTNLSDFVRRKALEAAEADVLNRSIEDYRALAYKPDFKAYLLGGPKVEDFPNERDRDAGRPVGL